MKKSEITEQAGIRAGAKVVCIDDAYQRVDLADAPDGLLAKGKVYCVSGFSDCGGVMLAGLRAISISTGSEVGFDPHRFLPLEEFRLKFPDGIASIPDDNDDFPIKEARLGQQAEFPEIEGLENPKPLIHRAIEILEDFYSENHGMESTPSWRQSGHWSDQSPAQVQHELRALLHSPKLPAYLNQQWRFWHFLIRRQKPTLVFCRSRSPLANLIFLMSMTGSTFTEQLLDGNLSERDFPVLTCAAGMLSKAPIRICDAREPDVLLRVLFDAHKHFDYAVCDWKLDGDELAAAYRMTQDSQISFLCPQD